MRITRAGVCPFLPRVYKTLQSEIVTLRGSPYARAGCVRSGMQCVRDCLHPWFGGNGECVVGADGTPACACDSGFSGFNVLGQPACESKAARTACHAGGFSTCLRSFISNFDAYNQPIAFV